ncbi:MAG TPA: 30S ribosomal protein S2 [Nitrososphaerales archaeon]|nr:30S ribosomal protein S2 [Nitrososphaerales archaeon]
MEWLLDLDMLTEGSDIDEEGSAEATIAPGLTERALLSTGIRIGTLVKTKSMAQFVSRTQANGLHVIDVTKTLNKIDAAAKFISRAEVGRVVVYSAREYAKTPIEKFCETTGAIALIGRFMHGTFTNPLFPRHLDPEIVVVADPAVDFQALDEASKLGIPVIAICDTDNVTANVDLVIPANNRGRSALAAIFWLLSRYVLLHTGALASDEQMKLTMKDFETKLVDEEEDDETYESS